MVSYAPTTCPACGSFHIHTQVRPMSTCDDAGHFLNGTSRHCLTCGHVWDRTATRAVGLQVEPGKPTTPRWRRLIAACRSFFRQEAR